MSELACLTEQQNSPLKNTESVLDWASCLSFQSKTKQKVS